MIEDEMSVSIFSEELSVENEPLSNYISEVKTVSVAELLVTWQEWSVANLRAYIEGAVALVGVNRSRHVGTVRAVLTCLADEQQVILDALQARMDALAKLKRKPPPPPDAAQPGDVRSCYGETQVHLDGRWFALGPERAP